MSSRNREVILQELKAAVAEERRSTLRVLHLLREVELKQLYLEMGYPSLFEFALKELGYSAGAAHRRLQSMRLLKDLPEFESKIQDGSLSLCVAAQAQSFFRQEDLRRREAGEARLDSSAKEEVVRSVLGTSSRECEARLAAISPEAVLPQEKARVLTSEQTLIQFVATRELMEKLERLKGLLAHQNFEGRYDRLFEILADLALKKWDPDAGPKRRESVQTIQSDRAEVEESARFTPVEMKAIGLEKVSDRGSEQVQARDSVGNEEGMAIVKEEKCARSTSEASPSSLPVLSFPTSETHRLPSFPTSKVGSPSSFRERTKPNPAQRTRYIQLSVKRAVWRRDGGGCTYRDPKTGRVCGSRHGIQVDHIHPYASGGESSVGNLRLLCGQHNRHAWGFSQRRMASQG